MNMLRALGATPPAYAHVPMILGPDGAKLSKRHGAASVLEYDHEGFLPEALLNYLVRLGWSHGDKELFTIEEMIAAFDIKDVNKAASVFNPEKLLWLNQQHMMRAPVARLAAGLQVHLARLGLQVDDQAMLEGVANALRERAKTLKDMAESSRFFFVEEVTFDEAAVRKHLTPEALLNLAALRARFAELPEWTPSAVHDALAAFASEKGVGLGKIAQPLRVAVSGTAVSPPIDATIALLGRERTLERLDRAVSLPQRSSS
jgi:glutamyl-tRNA synthetase